MEKIEKTKGITLVALVVAIIVLLLLAGIAIASLSGENETFSKVKQAKKAQLESEMKEQITMGLQELQVKKRGNATLDDVTQDWANEAILSDYSPILKEDASLNGKLIVMAKDGITGKFLIDQNLNISVTEYNTSSLEFEYTTISRTDNKVKINIVVTDKINGVKQIEYPEGDRLKVVSGTKDQISIDYEVELEQEYKFIITTGDGNKTEKIIKIDDYYYNVTKEFGENVTIDNNATKAAYNKTYEATISITDYYYIITGLTVTMGDKTITTSENDIVDINTGKIRIEKVTNDINIKIETKKLEIETTTPIIGTTTTAKTSVTDNSQNKGTKLYINFKATLEGKTCTITLKEDNNKTVPYAIISNGKYTFVATGIHNEKTITKEIEVNVNKYQSAIQLVKYDAGDWTKEEIEELKGQKLYVLNKKKAGNEQFYLKDSTNGLNFTFGGFTYKEDTKNASDIASGTIITSRNQSVQSSSNYGVSQNYSGWQILESNVKNGKTYVTKLVHAGSPENFVEYYTVPYDMYRAEYLLSSGIRMLDYKTLKTGELINPRKWDMYKDKNQMELIKDVHVITKDEAIKMTGDTLQTKGFRNIGVSYITASARTTGSVPYSGKYVVKKDGSIDPTYSTNWGAIGFRLVVEMNDGVYIVSGDGTEADPYILGKD